MSLCQHHGSCCHGMGLSAHAIRYGGVDHPYDPGDLNRCLAVSPEPPKHMKGRSPEWDVLVEHWAELADMLGNEMKWRDDDRAPKTYTRMRELLTAARNQGTP